MNTSYLFKSYRLITKIVRFLVILKGWENAVIMVKLSCPVIKII